MTFRLAITLGLLSSTFARASSPMIEDLTWFEVREAISKGKSSAIYYTGSIEQNGPAIALGKHNFVALHVARRVAEELGNVLVYPIMPFAPAGDPIAKKGHMRFPGTVSLSAETYGSVARDVIVSAKAAGFKNLFVMSDHGEGQEVLKKAAEKFDKQYAGQGFRVHYVGDIYFRAKKQMKRYLVRNKLPQDGHAGIDDTSEVLFIDRDKRWVRRDQLTAVSAVSGATGSPLRATPELGEIFVNYKVRAGVEEIRRLMSLGK
jgi:creatinine amidohydrolase